MSALDKIKDKAQQLMGGAKEKVGDATGNKDLEAEGSKDSAKGSLKQAGENVKDALS